MSRRVIELGGIVLAAAILLVVLANATLVDRVPPTVQRISLGRTNGDDHVGLTHTTVDVEFSEPVQHATAERRFHITPAVTGTISWDGARTLIFTPDQRLPIATTFHVTIDPGFADLAGNVSSAGTGDWAFSTIGLPTLASSVPAAGAADVPVDSAITLTFDRLMDVDLTQAAISIQPALSFRATWSGTTVTLTPSISLAYATQYTVEVSAQASDTDGNALDRPVAVTFTTVGAGLAVRQVLPAPGSGGAAVGGPIAIVFDGPIDPDTITGRVQVTPPASGNLVVGQVPSDLPGVEPVRNVLEFDPTSPLAPHTTYTVELLPGVQRLGDPTKVASGRTWTFTTGAPTETLQNQIVFLSARGGVRNVWAMNPDGTNAREITSEIAPVTSYDVSGDGRRIVYAVAGSVLSLHLSDASTQPLSPPSAADYAPCLTSDGTRAIVGRRDRASGQDLGWWLIPVASDAQPRQLVPDGAPPLGSADAAASAANPAGPGTWDCAAASSPDGQTAIVTDAAHEILEPALAGAGPATLTGLVEPASAVTWSDALRGYVVQARRQSDGTSGTWLLRPGEPPAQIAGAGASTDVSTHGDLVWVDEQSTPTGLAYLPAGQVQPAPLAADSLYLDRDPAFSPGGDVIVFARVQASGPGQSAGLWVIDTSGADLRQLAADGASPRWVP